MKKIIPIILITIVTMLTLPGVRVFGAEAPAAYEPTPEARIDFINENLYNLYSGEYAIDNGNIVSTAIVGEEGIIDISGQFGKEITIIKYGNYSTTVDSEPQTIEIPARPQSPTVYSVTLNEADGRITGLDKTKTYEYKAKNESDDTIETVTGVREIIGLALTDYQVRYAATEDRFASEWANVRVFDYDAPKVPILTSLTISEGTLNPDFNSSVIEYTVSVPYSVSSVTISASSNFMKTGVGEKSLSVGENTFAIQAYNSTNGTTRVYYITVTRQAYVPPVQPEPQPEPQPDPKPSRPSGNPSPPPKPQTYEPGDTQEYTTKSGITAKVTVTETGVEVEAGLNETGSVNSEATAAAVKKAAEIAYANGYKSITIKIPDGTTGLSKSTVQKLVQAANGTQIVLALTSMIDGEEVGSISLPINNKTGQILTGLYFETQRIYSVQNYIAERWNTNILGAFETAQKGGWGDTATLTVSIDKLGFSAEDGTKLYAIIYDIKTGKWYQVSSIIEDENVVIETKRTGVVTIVTKLVK